MRYLAVIACCLATALASGDQCRLADIPVQPYFNQAKFTGTWYEVELYPASWLQQYRPWQDFSQRVSEVRGQPGQIRVDFNYRKESDIDCGPEVTSIRRQTRPGYYTVTRQSGVPSIDVDANIIVATDYENFAVEFVCHDVYYDTCRDPEVKFWSRTKKATDDNIAVGRQLLSRLCVDQSQRYLIVQDPEATCSRKINPQCRFDDIPIANPYSSARASGRWYLIRTYPFAQFEPVEFTESFSYLHDGPGQVANAAFVDPGTGQCVQDLVYKLEEPTSGIYKYVDPYSNVPLVTKVSYASMNRQYGIMWTCRTFRGDICTNPSVSFVSRGKPTLTPSELAELVALVPKLCVDPTVYADIVQKDGCAPKPFEEKPETEVKPGDSPSGGFQDLLRAQKEMLVASRDKLRTEKETLLLRKEQLQLQIQRLRALYGY